MKSFEEFKRAYKEKESREGAALAADPGNPQNSPPGQSNIKPQKPKTDEEIRELYEQEQSESQTGVDHAGTVLGEPPQDPDNPDPNDHVLELRDVGK